jgi:glycosyltransferase involved in cell wall biosynthesis
MSIMANYWAEREWPVALVTLDVASSDFYALHPAIERVALGVSGVSATPLAAVRSNARRVAELRRALRALKPQAIISFLAPTTMLTVLAARSERVPVIVSDRTDPTQHRLGRFWTWVRLMVYPRASAVVVQTPEVRRWAERVVPAGIVHTIPNPVVASASRGDSSIAADRLTHSGSRRQVVAMGRLHVDKGFDDLLRAFASAEGARRGWHLVILGEGPERQRLQALADQLDIAAAVSLPGRVNDPSLVLRQSDLFVLSSRYEGFPNALLEAMAAGLAVIAADCPSGPRHIVRDGIDGLLVPPGDTEAMANAMVHVLGNDQVRKELADRAPDVIERFGIDQVMAKWERLLRSVALRADSAASPS